MDQSQLFWIEARSATLRQHSRIQIIPLRWSLLRYTERKKKKKKRRASKRGKHTERYRLLLHPFGLYISLYYIWVVCGSNPDLHLLALLDVCPTLLICASSDLLLHRRLLPSFLSQSATPVAPYYMTNSFTSSFWSGSVLHGSHTRLVDVLFLLGSHIFQPRTPRPAPLSLDSQTPKSFTPLCRGETGTQHKTGWVGGC